METRELIEEYVDILLNSPDIHSLIIGSPAGLGKTTIVLNKIANMGLVEDRHFVYQTGYITPLKFYEFLSRCRTLELPKLIVLDDIDSIILNKTSLGILKCALTEARGKRIVKYESRSSEEKEFEFNGKIILITNNLSDNKQLAPVLDRGIVYNFEKDLPIFIKYIETHLTEIYPSLNKEEKIEVWERVKRFVGMPNFSFRVLNRAFAFYKNNKKNWYELFVRSLRKL